MAGNKPEWQDYSKDGKQRYCLHLSQGIVVAMERSFSKADWSLFVGQWCMILPPMSKAKAQRLALQYVKGLLLELLEPLKGVRAKTGSEGLL